MTRPAIITFAHMALLAVGYGRQSTMGQFEKNTGSTDHQRGQLRYPREWGWAEALLLWLDDFGLSGTAPEHRPGYLRLRRLVQAGKVGLVCVSDMSRLGRNAAELLSFLADCRAHGVLLAVDGKILDPRDSSDWLINAVQAVLGEHGGNNIRDTLQHGRIAKLESGIAVSYPPIGYDQGPRKEWRVTEDPAVRSAMATVFRVFLECRTLRSSVVRLRKLGAKVPRRKPGHPIHWRDATVNMLQDILNNPNYTSDYYYRRRVDDPTKPRSAKGRRRVRKARPEEIRIIRDHHEGYLSAEQWAEIQGIFDNNGWSQEHANAGVGAAWVQGLIRCRQHACRRMSVRYKHGEARWPRSYSYRCMGEYFEGHPQCGQVSGARIDEAVARAVIGRLEPPSVEAVRLAFEQSVADARSERRHHEIERARLAQHVADLEGKLEALDRDCVNVIKSLGQRLEQAKRELNALDAVDDASRDRAVQADLRMLAEAADVAANVWRIWDAPTTQDRDRKELLRILVRGIIVEERTAERLRLRIQWIDRVEDEFVDVWTQRGVDRLMNELFADGVSSEAIATRLNSMGLKTRRGNVFTAKRVRQAVCARERRGRRQGMGGADDRLRT